MRKIPEDAFAFYVSLGSDRSYQAVADHFKVNKRSVVKVAGKQDWTGRLAKIEEAAQQRVDKKLVEDMAEIRVRHAKLLRAMGSRAAKAIQEFPLTSGMEGLRAAEMVIKLERIAMGEPSERTAVTVEAVTRAEIDKLVGREGENTEHDDGEEGDDDW